MSDDRFDNRRYYNEDTFSIQSTAGAVPVRNKKGEVSMEKVKVSRYISGKRPEYASRGRDERSSSESDSSDEEDFTRQRQKSPKHEVGVLNEDFIPNLLVQKIQLTAFQSFKNKVADENLHFQRRTNFLVKFSFRSSFHQLHILFLEGSQLNFSSEKRIFVQ